MTEEEIARLRGYLATQSMKRTPAQITEALQEAYHQFVSAVKTVPNADAHTPEKHIWSLAEVVEHVSLFLSLYTAAICSVLEGHERPADVQDRQDILPRDGDKADIPEKLRKLEGNITRLAQVVLQADPLGHLEMTWKHFELGAMHWREWLLFARVHLLDHVRQVEQMQPAE